MQYAGFSATRELETFRLLNHARNLDEFKTALQYFDVGSQNFIYGDIDGNIGYFTTGEVPLREDLQAGTVNGSPPWFIRDGQGGNEWLGTRTRTSSTAPATVAAVRASCRRPSTRRTASSSTPTTTPSGTTLDNNPLNQLRPGGQGIYFLGYSFDHGTRAGRITAGAQGAPGARGPVDRSDMKAIQADVTLLDAEVFTPYITGAFDRAQQAGAPPALVALAADAARRRGGWPPQGVELHDADGRGDGL